MYLQETLYLCIYRKSCICVFAGNAVFVGSRLGLCWLLVEEQWPQYKEGVGLFFKEKLNKKRKYKKEILAVLENTKPQETNIETFFSQCRDPYMVIAEKAGATFGGSWGVVFR